MLIHWVPSRLRALLKYTTYLVVNDDGETLVGGNVNLASPKTIGLEEGDNDETGLLKKVKDGRR